MLTTFLALAFLLTPDPTDVAGPPPLPWGAKGHEMAARAAADGLPSEMPAFFRGARYQLEYLDPEPDRWREAELREMDQAWSYDHYIDLERVPDLDPGVPSYGALDAQDRFTFLRALYRAGIERPERDVGLLPFRIVELYQRLVTEWRLWRAAPEGSPERTWIEFRIVNDAGILGHYVTDAANPHHTTIHFNGWDADTPNPEGYTTDRDFHARFESRFVGEHVDPASVRAADGPPVSVAGDARRAVLDYLLESNRRVEELYRLDRDAGFAPEEPVSQEAVDFAVERLGHGAEMLRILWWSAWLESA